MRVECTECRFTRVVERDDEDLPGETVQRHRNETDHVLHIIQLDDE